MNRGGTQGRRSEQVTLNLKPERQAVGGRRVFHGSETLVPRPRVAHVTQNVEHDGKLRLPLPEPLCYDPTSFLAG